MEPYNSTIKSKFKPVLYAVLIVDLPLNVMQHGKRVYFREVF